MSSDQRDNEQIFNASVEINDPVERASFLEEACRDNPELRAEIEELLKHDVGVSNFLKQPAVATIDMLLIAESVGSVIGPYKLMEQIGEGGMGVVYIAQQEEPIRRKVALKIIKPGMDTKNVIARFESERQALALMDHSNIARVLDAGATETGRPYFVMELVRGISITEYCDQTKLTTTERLKLFITVCQAVQHAHQKGIIHRDIKPTNVLVTQIDGAAVPKVIDFGIAKAIDQKLTEQSVTTQFSHLVGTPLYMSPEQAEMGGVDIDTRSDVYSLGVLLYELLTGTTPFDKDTLEQAGYDEMRRIIREEEPLQPSDRISTLHAEALSTLSEQRNINTHKFSNQIQGELDWIVMRALAKDRTCRYESAGALAADVQRFLDDEPVEACLPSRAYRLKKFVRRNKVILTTTTLVALSLVTGTAVSIWQAVDANDARDLANQRLVQVNDAARATDEQHDRAEENLRLAIKVLDDISVPLAENRLLHGSELLQADRDLLQKALTFYEQFATNNRDTRSSSYVVAKAYQRVGEIKQALGFYQDAERVFNRAIDDFSKLLREFPQQTEYRQMLAASYNSLGNALQAQKIFTEAETVYRKAIDLQQSLLGWFPLNPDHRAALADSHNNLGVLLVTTDDREQAHQAFSQSAEFRQTLVDENPRVPRYRYRLSAVQINLANLAKEMGQPDQAQQLIQDALRSTQMLVDQFPNRRHYLAQFARVHNTLGVLLKQSEQFQQAETALKKSGSLWETLIDEWPNIPGYQRELGAAVSNFGGLMRRLRRHEESADAYRDAARVRRRLVRKFPHNQSYEEDLARTCGTIGDMLRSQPHTSPEAETWFREAGDHWENLAADSPSESRFSQRLAQTSNKLGILLAPQDPTRANQAYQKSLNALQTFANLDPENSSKPGFRDSFAKTHHNLGLLLTGIKPEQAEESFRMALNEFRKLQVDYPDSPSYRFNVASTNNALGNLTFATGRKQDAKQFFQQARDIRIELAEKYSSQPVLQNSLAWFLATCPDPEFRNPSRAVKFARRAIQREKQKGHYYNTLGVALYRAGCWKLARKSLEASVSLNKGGDGSDWIFLAMVHWQLKNHDQAHRWYRKAANWITDNKPHDLELKRFRIEAEQLLGIPVVAPVPRLGSPKKEVDDFHDIEKSKSEARNKSKIRISNVQNIF